jgi:hypothetical protein
VESEAGVMQAMGRVALLLTYRTNSGFCDHGRRSIGLATGTGRPTDLISRMGLMLNLLAPSPAPCPALHPDEPGPGVGSLVAFERRMDPGKGRGFY